MGYAIFRRFREDSTLASTGDLNHLSGHGDQCFWSKDGDPPNQLPPKTGDSKTLDDLFAQLKSY